MYAEGLRAVRWARRIRHRELDYTKRHLTEDGYFALCGAVVRLAVATLFPEEEIAEMADCKHCLRRVIPQ
jgi:hypothetical protein